ncbi:MAG: hypothetical protein NTV34_11790, partial [Proteobacteria bacterium]|nr:hypothetical protein [Pseudomonadota bacterium]
TTATIYYKEDLERVITDRCQKDGCTGCDAPLFHYSCCEKSPPKIMYYGGSLYLTCRKCGELMSEIMVATKPVESGALKAAS